MLIIIIIIVIVVIISNIACTGSRWPPLTYAASTIPEKGRSTLFTTTHDLIDTMTSHNALEGV